MNSDTVDPVFDTNTPASGASAPVKAGEEIKVFISNRDSKCDECGERLGRQAWITLERDKGALCLTCGDLDHLVFLPSGDAALTRRAKKHSTLYAVVLKFSRARRQYERQGLLVEEGALEQAELSASRTVKSGHDVMSVSRFGVRILISTTSRSLRSA